MCEKQWYSVWAVCHGHKWVMVINKGRPCIQESVTRPWRSCDALAGSRITAGTFFVVLPAEGLSATGATCARTRSKCWSCTSDMDEGPSSMPASGFWYIHTVGVEAMSASSIEDPRQHLAPHVGHIGTISFAGDFLPCASRPFFKLAAPNGPLPFFWQFSCLHSLHKSGLSFRSATRRS